jgi:DNA-binding CsgD family transcriptional regulator
MDFRQRRKAIKALILAGEETYREIGARFGISWQRVQQIASAEGLHRSIGHRTRESLAIDEQLRKLAERGATTREISMRLAISPSKVRDRAMRLGLTLALARVRHKCDTVLVGALIAQGKTTAREIVERTGVARSDVYIYRQHLLAKGVDCPELPKRPMASRGTPSPVG